MMCIRSFAGQCNGNEVRKGGLHMALHAILLIETGHYSGVSMNTERF